jgi:hypothetical protein
MSDSTGPDRIEVGKREEFNSALAQLRSVGATALVTGTADPVAFHRISGHLLGDIESNRIPVFVLVGRNQNIIQERTRHPAAVNEFQIVEFMSELADAYEPRGPRLRIPNSEDEHNPDDGEPANDFSAASEESSGRPPETTDLEVLYERVVDAVESVSRRYQLDAWDLRIAIDSCIPLLEYNELDASVDFFDRIGDLTRDHTGLTHAVYPIPLNSERAATADSVDDLLDAFDIHIRVRSQQGHHETQWELLDFDCRTAWLDLPPAHQSLP